jgi:hypothetical protein
MKGMNAFDRFKGFSGPGSKPTGLLPGPELTVPMEFQENAADRRM